MFATTLLMLSLATAAPAQTPLQAADAALSAAAAQMVQTLAANERAAHAVPTAQKLAIEEAIGGPNAYRLNLFSKVPEPTLAMRAQAAALRFKANLVGNVAYLRAQHALVSAQKARNEAAFYARK